MALQFKRKTKLHVIEGGLHCKMTVNDLRIIAAPKQSPPFQIEALAVEEDTYLIMSAEPSHVPPTESPLRFMAELAKLQPEKPGSIVIKGKNPLRLLAIVHDVNKDPTWRETWIEKALFKIFQEADLRQIATLGLPMIGTKHGRFENHRFGELLAETIRISPFNYLKKIWLIAPVPENNKLIKLLKSRLN